MGISIHGLPYVDQQESPTVVLAAEDTEHDLDSIVSPRFENDIAEKIHNQGPEWACVMLNMLGPLKTASVLRGV